MLTSSHQWMQDDSVVKQVLGGPDVEDKWDVKFLEQLMVLLRRARQGAFRLKSLKRKTRTFSLCRTAGQECRPSVCGVCVA